MESLITNNTSKQADQRRKLIGRLGEDITCKFLMKLGFSILGKNFRRKCGELDIISKNNGVIEFFEVKSISCEDIRNVTRETLDGYRPEDNIHPWKLKRLSRTIQSYLLDKKVSDETNWKFGFSVVFIDLIRKEARIKLYEDIIL